MDTVHPNLQLLQRLDIHNLDSCKDIISEDFVFHYFNPNLFDLEGDYVGLAGLQDFFRTLGEKMTGTFNVEPISATAVGNELVVSQTRNSMTFQKRPIVIDVVVVWRFVDGKIAEAWDIPSAYTEVAVEEAN